MYAKFGSSVTMLEYSRRFLPREDADMAQSVRAALEAQGVDIHLGVSARRCATFPKTARPARNCAAASPGRTARRKNTCSRPTPCCWRRAAASDRRAEPGGRGRPSGRTRGHCRGRPAADLPAAYPGSGRRQGRPAVHLYFPGRLPHCAGRALGRGQTRHRQPGARGLRRVHGPAPGPRGPQRRGSPRPGTERHDCQTARRGHSRAPACSARPAACSRPWRTRTAERFSVAPCTARTPGK